MDNTYFFLSLQEATINIPRDAGDPIHRLAPILNVLHRFSPLQAIIYLRLTIQHIYSRHKYKIRTAILLLLLALYFVYLGVALR